MKDLPKVKIKKSGSSGPNLAIVYCMHGDEKLGKKIADYIYKLRINKGILTTILANPKAYSKNKRFIDEDLNRIFPGKSKTYEQKLAKNILKIVKNTDYLVDIHTTTGKTEPFAIVINKNLQTIGLIKSTGIKNVILMGKNLASGKSLIDQTKNGFSIEYYSKTLKKSLKIGTENIKALLVGTRMVKGENLQKNKLTFYQVVSVLDKPENFIVKVKFKNFSLIKKGTLLGFLKKEPVIADKNFYPIFHGEKAYPELVCLQAVKVSNFFRLH